MVLRTLTLSRNRNPLSYFKRGGEAQATEDLIRILACHHFGPFVCDAIKSAIVTASAVIDFEHRAMEYLTNLLN
jgi:hypothetical protein